MKTKGWKNVFAFSFVQQVKTKSFIVGTVVISVIVAVMAFLANFLPTLFLNNNGGSPDGGSTLTVTDLYISNETGYDIDLTDLSASLGINVKMITAAQADEKLPTLDNSTAGEMLSRITVRNGTFSVDSVYAGKNELIQKNDCSMINSTVAQVFKAKYLMSFGVPESDLTLSMSGISTTLTCAGQESVSEIQNMVRSIVPMISSIILFIFIFSYSQLVAQSVAIEKSSRIVEYLLTSIKPLALIIGKILAMCCVSLMQFVIIVVSGTLGFVVAMPIGIFSKLDAAVTAVGQSASGAGSEEGVQYVINEVVGAFSNVDGTIFIIMIVVFVLGFLLFAGLAGLAGSSVSKMEDLAPALQPVSIIGVLGFYLAYFPQVTGEENTMSVIARYLPISSPFVLPTDYMLGKIGIAEALISIAVLAVADVLLMMFVAKVYESIILHTGNRLKVGDMIKMSK